MSESTPFRDREDAGRRLAQWLEQYRNEDPIILALPRRGVPVGYEIALSLGAPLDVFLSRKLGAPGRKEFGIGTVAQGGVRVLDEHAVEAWRSPKSAWSRCRMRRSSNCSSAPGPEGRA